MSKVERSQCQPGVNTLCLEPELSKSNAEKINEVVNDSKILNNVDTICVTDAKIKAVNINDSKSENIHWERCKAASAFVVGAFMVIGGIATLQPEIAAPGLAAMGIGIKGIAKQYQKEKALIV